MKRFIYLLYYFRELDWEKFRRFSDYVKNDHQKSRIRQFFEIVFFSLKYKISILEYYYFRFYQKETDKKTWAGTGYMYEYQLYMNPKQHRLVLADKTIFLDRYRDFVKHSYWKKGDDLEKLRPFLAHDRVVLKASDGQCGIGIQVISPKDLSTDGLIKKMNELRNDMIEEFVVQHDDLQYLSPSGLNTLRIISQINKDGGVDILGARLRITINNSVDNLAAGNIAAAVDLDSGIIIETAVYSDIMKDNLSNHPVSNASIVGFKVPFFKESVDLVSKAALLIPGNRSIGWDVAITNSGPELIEGNHDWCKLLWQLPVKTGLKYVLEDYKKGIK